MISLLGLIKFEFFFSCLICKAVIGQFILVRKSCSKIYIYKTNRFKSYISLSHSSFRWENCSQMKPILKSRSLDNQRINLAYDRLSVSKDERVTEQKINCEQAGVAVVIFREKAVKCFFKPSHIPPYLVFVCIDWEPGTSKNKSWLIPKLYTVVIHLLLSILHSYFLIHMFSIENLVFYH